MKLSSVRILALTATMIAGAAIVSASDAEARTYYRTHCWRQAVHGWGHYGRYTPVRYGYARRAVYGYSRPGVYGYAQPAAYGYSQPAVYGMAAPGCGCGAADVYGYGGYGGYGGGLLGLGFGGGGLLGLGLGPL